VSSGAASADVAAAPVDQASVDQAAALASTCSGCHRAGGSAIVDLQAYSAPRIEQLLLAYKHSADGPTAMHRMARGYSDAEIALIARRLGK
jgi:sulfide dehydrogenase cytochrome subunit